MVVVKVVEVQEEEVGVMVATAVAVLVKVVAEEEEEEAAFLLCPPPPSPGRNLRPHSHMFDQRRLLLRRGSRRRTVDYFWSNFSLKLSWCSRAT